MKILMLGWEYPPHISGGLGTACQGLTTALSSLGGVDIDFVIPRLVGRESAPHMHLLDSYAEASGPIAEVRKDVSKIPDEIKTIRETAQGVHVTGIPSRLSPYLSAETYQKLRAYYSRYRKTRKQFSGSLGELSEDDLEVLGSLPHGLSELFQEDALAGVGDLYGPDLFAEVGRFARNVVVMARDREFDLIHAHDWMTYPAAVAVAKLTGVPLVVHVHSIEYDRSGNGGNERIRQIEKAGMEVASRVIAVSYYTRSVVNEQYGIPLEKVGVVHNGVYSGEVVRSYRAERKENSRVVLFLGRITFQKGPDYFVEAAARVAPLVPDAKFVMAGTGDMLPRLKERVEELGLSDRFVFTGFLKGPDVEKMFSMADLYIMPSVSEPFGITPLEAMSHDVPVIISRQSGVSEVLQNAFKVDFWDIDKLSSLIIGVLKYPEVREDIIKLGREEVRRLRWDAAAQKVREVYQQTLERVASGVPAER